MYFLYIVLRATMRGTPSVIALPLRDIEAVIEDRVILLSGLVVTYRGVNYTLSNAAKSETKVFVEYFNMRKLELMQNSSQQQSAQEVTLQSKEAIPTSQEVISPAVVSFASTSTNKASQPVSKKQKKKPGCMTRILQGIFVVFISVWIVSVFEDKDGNLAKNRINNTNTEITTKADEQVKPEDTVRELIIATLGAKTNMGSKRLISISRIPQVDGTTTLDIRLRIDDNFSARYIILGYLDKVRRLMKNFFSDSRLSGYDEFRNYGSFPMKNMYGNVEEQFINKTFLKRSVAKKINWDNVAF